jgi:hypothetical protein
VLKTCLFIGPTGLNSGVHGLVDRYPPACLGSVFRAVERGYRQIGIVDAYFGNVATVWHKEILFALSRQVVVMGSRECRGITCCRARALRNVGLRRCVSAFSKGDFGG